ncbi:MAG: protein kinase [Chloroflexi bacterium]|nr:protein kinase [Chloroflexota bacterium]
MMKDLPEQQINGFYIIDALRQPSGQAQVYLVTDLFSAYKSHWLRFLINSQCLSLRTAQRYRVMVLKLTRQEKNALDIHNEVDLLKKIQHTHLALLIGEKESLPIKYHDRYFITLKYECGGSLISLWQAKKQRFTSGQAVQLGYQIAQVLAYLHTECRVAHNDVSMDNIMLREPLSIWRKKLPHYVLIDLAAAQDKLKFSRLGKERYQPPEYLDPRLHQFAQGDLVDLYAMGMLLYLLLGGKHQLDSNTNEAGKSKEAWIKLKEGLPAINTVNSVVSEQLNMLIMDALEPNPTQRRYKFGSENLMTLFLQRIQLVPEFQQSGRIRRPISSWIYLSVMVSLLMVVLGVWLIDAAFNQPILALSPTSTSATVTPIPSKTPIPSPTATISIPTIEPTSTFVPSPTP